MKKKNGAVGVLIIVIGFAISFVLGGALDILSLKSAPTTEGEQQILPAQTGKAELVVKTHNNPCAITFVAPCPIAPDFRVGFGIGSDYEVYELFDPAEWDPLGIGVDTPMTLIRLLRQQVPGLTEDIYAKGYELSVTIAESHLTRKDLIIEEIKEILNDYYSEG